MKVHVISLSWTIAAPASVEALDAEDRAALDELETAISIASKSNILLFCSASDDGAVEASTYPSKFTKQIFRIGAADTNGHASKAVGNIDSVDFLLPGKLVNEESEYEDIKNVQLWTGSSIATALASGLAALILYCARIRISRAVNEEEMERAQAHFEKLKTHDGMMMAFSSIGMSSTGKLRKVWEVFGKKFNEYKENSRLITSREPIDLVADVAATLCAKF